MPPEDNLHDLLQIDVPDLASSEEEPVPPRDADLLNSLRVASPCDASWEAMEGDDLVRFCQDCRKNVYNLSAMSRRDAAAFVREAEGKLCVRFYRRHDGTLLTDNCPVGWRTARRWLLTQMLGALSLFGLGFGAVIRSALERSHLLELERVGHSGRGGYVMGGPPGSVSEPPLLPVLQGEVAPVIMVTPYREATPRRRHRRRLRHGRRR